MKHSRRARQRARQQGRIGMNVAREHETREGTTSLSHSSIPQDLTKEVEPWTSG